MFKVQVVQYDYLFAIGAKRSHHIRRNKNIGTYLLEFSRNHPIVPDAKQDRMPSLGRQYVGIYIGGKNEFGSVGPIENEVKLMLGVHARNARKNFVGEPTDAVELAPKHQSCIDRNLHIPKVLLNGNVKEKAANWQPSVF